MLDQMFSASWSFACTVLEMQPRAGKRLSARSLSLAVSAGVSDTQQCSFWHPDRDITTLVHGDDYVSLGRQADLDWMEIQLQAAYEIQTQVGAR